MKRGRAVKVVPQRHDYDCGTACLAMLLDVPYGDAAAAVRAVYNPKGWGVTTKALQVAAQRLGARLRAVRKRGDYLDGHTGILGIKPTDTASGLPDCGHWTILKAGVIVDTDGTVWPNVADYLKAKRARPVTLLVKVNKTSREAA